MKYYVYFILTLILVQFSDRANAQMGSGKAKVTGRVRDSQSGMALGYASIRLHQASDDKLQTGNITTDNGGFNLDAPFGQYYAVVEFMGYKTLKTPSFSLSKDKPVHDLGELKIQAVTNNLNEVVVQAEKSTMEISLDKKIFNVGKDLGNAGGSATEILSNIPSVSVDAEGRVKLRGSDNVRILIDGKPSGLVSFKGGAGLQQLQDNLIEKVEIITNPSARYEAEGMSGIINIVLKKERKEGFNGSFELVSGNPSNFGAAANVNYRRKNVNFFLNYGLTHRVTPYRSTLYQEVYDNDTTFILKQNNSGRVKGFNNSIRGGLDYFLSETSILTGSYLFRRSDANRVTKIRYEDYFFTRNQETYDKFTTRRQDEDEDEPNSEYAVTYKKTFTRPGQELVADLRFLDYWERSNQLFTQQTYLPNETKTGTVIQRSLNDEFEKQYLVQVDYVQPLGAEGKFETGFRSSFRDMVNDYEVTQENAGGAFSPVPGLDNYFIYNENIHAAYGILGNKTKQFSYQFGLRAEQTDVVTTLRETDGTPRATDLVNPRSYTNLFPSAHFTYNLPKENALQISYSRRVRRPLYNDLSPFSTFSDSRNFNSGNPNLNPEFSNAFDLGHIKYFDKGSFSSSLYYRSTTDKIQRVRLVDRDGNAVIRPENLAGEDAFGAEFTSSVNVLAWWKADLNFNFFRAITDGSNFGEDFSSDTYSWFARHTSRIKLPHKIDLQARLNYEAPQRIPQGKLLALYYLDLGLSKDIFKEKGTITLNTLDVFNTRRNRSILEGTNGDIRFYSRGSSQRALRQVNLTLSYRLNQAKSAAPNKAEGE